MLKTKAGDLARAEFRRFAWLGTLGELLNRKYGLWGQHPIKTLRDFLGFQLARQLAAHFDGHEGFVLRSWRFVVSK
jgi:hypothetical protein